MSKLQIRKATRRKPTILAVQLNEENYKDVVVWLIKQMESIEHHYGRCNYSHCGVREHNKLMLACYDGCEYGELGDWAVVEQNIVRFVPDSKFYAIYQLGGAE